mgnify:CR=1 FL=1
MVEANDIFISRPMTDFERIFHSFQIHHYTNLMNNAKSLEQKFFLRKQLHQLKKVNAGFSKKTAMQ